LETDDLADSRPGVLGVEGDDASSENAGQSTTEENDPAGVDVKLTSILESLLFAAGEPVSLSQLANALENVPREHIRKTLSEMAAEYASNRRGFVLEEIASGYQLRTPAEHAVYVRRLLSAKPPRLSRPVLETLAIVAYRQPVTRPEIEQLRGVDSGGVLDTLLERSLIKIAGRREGPGRPILYTTTTDFLELFGLKDLESLPDLEEFRELEGLRDPTDAPQASHSADSFQVAVSESPHDPESDEQNLLTGSVNSSITQADEIIDKANTSSLMAENPDSPTEADEPKEH
jgi:segregation and condensation protein B